MLKTKKYPQFCNFWLRLLNWMQDLNFFIGVLFGFELKGWSCKMCKSVGQKYGHTRGLFHHALTSPGLLGDNKSLPPTKICDIPVTL